MEELSYEVLMVLDYLFEMCFPLKPQKVYFWWSHGLHEVSPSLGKPFRPGPLSSTGKPVDFNAPTLNFFGEGFGGSSCDARG